MLLGQAIIALVLGGVLSGEERWKHEGGSQCSPGNMSMGSKLLLRVDNRQVWLHAAVEVALNMGWRSVQHARRCMSIYRWAWQQRAASGAWFGGAPRQHAASVARFGGAPAG